MNRDGSAAFGDLLRRLRKAAGLTQAELAERAGLSIRGINDLERGARRFPHKDTVTLLADALELAGDERTAFLASARRVPPIAKTDTTAPQNHPAHNLPIQPTPLLGREREVAELDALLRREDIRLVTLTGPGGVGKTRLAQRVAAELLDAFADGVWLVRLSRLTDPALVVPTIAQTLGHREAGSQPIEAVLREWLRSRSVLLLLDNFEHMVTAAVQVADLLATSPGLTVLATSRMSLRVQGEREVPVSPLALPAEGGAHSPAVMLFVQRAQASRPDFRMTDATAPTVAAICERLDGLPLAIELAAPRVKLLPPAQLLKRLDRQLPLLIGGVRDVEERQQTMRGTLAWSYDLLSPEERRLFRRLAVFVGGCTLEAAEAACVAPGGAEPLELDVLEGLGRLVDQSLVQQREEGSEPRFGMLHVVREYALEQLEVSGEGEALRRAHAEYVLELAERAEPELTGPEQRAWMDRLEREHDNIRAALGWARERGETETALRLATAVSRFWITRGHLREGRAWVDGLLTLASEPGSGKIRGEAASTAGSAEMARGRALIAGGWLASWQGDEAAAVPWLEQAMAFGRAGGDLETVAVALTELGNIDFRHDDWERAAARYEESLAIFRQIGDQRDSAMVLENLGEAAYYQGDLERAATTFGDSLALARHVGDRDTVASCLLGLGVVARLQGAVPEAEALGREALALYWEVGEQFRCADGLERLACTAGAAAQGERAARLLGAAAALREMLGAPQQPPDRADTEQTVAAARAALGEERWAAAFAAGRAMTLEEAIAEALGE